MRETAHATTSGDAPFALRLEPSAAVEERDHFVSRWPRSRLASVVVHCGVAIALLAGAVATDMSLPHVTALVGAGLLGLVVARLAFDLLPSPRSLQPVASPAVIAGAAMLGSLALVASAWLLGTRPSVGEMTCALLCALGVLAIASMARTLELRRGQRMQRDYLIGTQAQQFDLAREIRFRGDRRLVGWLPLGPATVTLDLDEAAAAIVRAAPSTLLLSDEALRDQQLVALASRLNLGGIHVRELREFYEQEFEKVAVSDLSDSWFLFDIAGIHDGRVYRLCKRTLETLIASVVLLLALPLFPLIALGISVSSRGPLLFRQPRTGKDGRSLVLSKFRTMRVVADCEPGSWAGAADARVFPFGRFLRRFRLDELPQLLHVVLGELSLVGPRPEQPPIVARLEKQMPYYAARRFVRPGLTGWAQVNYGYGGSDEGALTKLQYDLFYVKHQSLGLDLRIVAATARAVLRGRG